MTEFFPRTEDRQKLKKAWQAFVKEHGVEFLRDYLSRKDEFLEPTEERAGLALFNENFLLICDAYEAQEAPRRTAAQIFGEAEAFIAEKWTVAETRRLAPTALDRKVQEGNIYALFVKATRLLKGENTQRMGLELLRVALNEAPDEARAYFCRFLKEEKPERHTSHDYPKIPGADLT